MGKAHQLRCFLKDINFPHAGGLDEIMSLRYNAQLWLEVCILQSEIWNCP